MRSLAFAWVSLVRQPTRTMLGVAGIAAVGALLFDMLLLSRGLVVSFRDLLDGAGFDIRVMAAEAMPLAGPRLPDARRLAAAMVALPEVEAAVPIRFGAAEARSSSPASGRSSPEAESPSGLPRMSAFTFVGAGGSGHRPWTIVAGSDLRPGGEDRPALVVNRRLAEQLGVGPGGAVAVHGTCDRERSAAPSVAFRVAGIAEFPFDTAGQLTAATTLPAHARACGEPVDEGADLLLVASRRGTDAAVAAAAVGALDPTLHVFTNEELIDRLQQTDFSYFRQISVVLASVTLLFGFLLITVLLTISVNQRLGHIAALRAVGLSRGRVMADVLWESLFLVGLGGLIALPLGLALAGWLDGILRGMPGIPAGVAFFVFEARALALHAALLGLTALGAAVYPMWLVARLPIAATLREEVVS